MRRWGFVLLLVAGCGGEPDDPASAVLERDDFAAVADPNGRPVFATSPDDPVASLNNGLRVRVVKDNPAGNNYPREVDVIAAEGPLQGRAFRVDRANLRPVK